MRNLKLGFALEGNSDYPVIPVLTHRVLQAAFPQIELAKDSIRKPRKRGHGFVRELPTFARELCDEGVDIVVAVVDTDNGLVTERRRLVQESKKRCEDSGVPACIADGLAVHALEAWLIADEAALVKVFDGDRTAIAFHAPEQDKEPKRTLNRIVRTLTLGRELSFASYASELAAAIRLELLRQRCPHFDDFAQNVSNCTRDWLRAVQGEA